MANLAECLHCGVPWSQHSTGSQLCHDVRAHERIAELAREVARIGCLLHEVATAAEEAGDEALKQTATRVLKQWRGR
jgi:hypothetical protein